MIYEAAYIVRADAAEDAVAALKNSVADTLKEFGAEVLVNDSWGVKTFAQPTESGLKKGAYHYVMYKSAGSVNAELERKFGINESVLRFLVIKLGDDKKQADILKAYKNPNQAKAVEAGADDEEGGFGGGGDKEKRMHSKKRSCYFSATKTQPDWKDPKSYSWLVNEFGKISAARITGLTPKFQRSSNAAIKRGRNMGLISYISNEIAY